MAPLFQIGLLVLFSVIVFAIIGVEIYGGAFHAACRNNETGTLREEFRAAPMRGVD